MTHLNHSVKEEKPVWLRETSQLPQLQVVGQVPKKYLPINLFDIQVRLYKCVKVWMVKIWKIFGQPLILQNFSGAKVSLHMV